MRKFATYFFLIFSLLIAPVIHAADLDCVGDNCNTVKEQSEKSGKMAKADHACCCHHNVTDRLTVHISTARTEMKKVSYFINTVGIPSAIVGPLLEPPSHV